MWNIDENPINDSVCGDNKLDYNIYAVGGGGAVFVPFLHMFDTTIPQVTIRLYGQQQEWPASSAVPGRRLPIAVAHYYRHAGVGVASKKRIKRVRFEHTIAHGHIRNTHANNTHTHATRTFVRLYVLNNLNKSDLCAQRAVCRRRRRRRRCRVECRMP